MIDTTFSVVIPTHNRPGALARVVKSVLDQTRPPDEIIIVDDGSTPPADTSSFDDAGVDIHLLRNNDRMGPAAARNRGVMEAQCEFVAFVDDDDLWLPTKLELVASCIDAHPDADVIIHQTGYTAPSVRVESTCSPVADPLMRMIRTQPPHLDGVVVRGRLHLSTAFDEHFVAAEDFDYLMRLARSKATMIESQAVLAVFGQDLPSVIGIESRIQGRRELLTRHPEIREDAAATSFYYVRLGHLQRRAGHRSAAMGSFLKACRHTPLSPLGWKGLARCMVSD